MSEAISVSLDGLSVIVGMPTSRDLPPLTVKSLLATFAKCRAVSVPCELGMVANCAVITKARDEVVDLFLKSTASRLFWIDSDMVWEPEQFLRLLALSKLRKVVTAAYPAKTDRPTFYVNFESGTMQDDLGLIPIKGVGLGFTVMDREVVERLAESAPKMFDQVSGISLASIFRADITPEGYFRGEDMAFFDDIRNLGYVVYLDPYTDLGHVGTKVYTGKIMDAMQKV